MPWTDTQILPLTKDKFRVCVTIFELELEALRTIESTIDLADLDVDGELDEARSKATVTLAGYMTTELASYVLDTPREPLTECERLMHAAALNVLYAHRQLKRILANAGAPAAARLIRGYQAHLDSQIGNGFEAFV